MRGRGWPAGVGWGSATGLRVIGVATKKSFPARSLRRLSAKSPSFHFHGPITPFFYRKFWFAAIAIKTSFLNIRSSIISLKEWRKKRDKYLANGWRSWDKTRRTKGTRRQKTLVNTSRRGKGLFCQVVRILLRFRLVSMYIKSSLSNCFFVFFRWLVSVLYFLLAWYSMVGIEIS